jgi:cell division protein FtsN
MVEREPGLNEALFMGLIINLQSTAMIALGKLINPLTQNIERNLDQAHFTIDMLGMLEDKTDGNRTEEETRTLRRVLTELRMNYLDEVEKERKEQEKEREKNAREKTSEKAEQKTAEKPEGGPDGKSAEKPAGKPAAEDTEENAQQRAQEKTARGANDKKV